MAKDLNPRIRAAFLEAVENQLRNNDPPETQQTYDRLLREGHSETEAKELISAAIAAETFHVMKKGEPFNHGRFVETLNRLPQLPA